VIFITLYQTRSQIALEVGEETKLLPDKAFQNYLYNKGQKILKSIDGVFNFSKKMNKTHCPEHIC